MKTLQTSKFPSKEFARKTITRSVFEKQSEGVSKIYEKMQESFSIKRRTPIKDSKGLEQGSAGKQ